MVVFKEARHLEMLKCYYNEAMDVFVFQCAGKKITIQYASPEQIATVFRKAQVKDEQTMPHSARGKTYLEMVAAIINGTDHENYLWSTDVDLFFSACEEIRQSRIGKVVPPPIHENKETPMLIITSPAAKRHTSTDFRFYEHIREKYLVATITWKDNTTNDQIFDTDKLQNVEPAVGTKVSIGSLDGKITKIRKATASEITAFKKSLGE